MKTNTEIIKIITSLFITFSNKIIFNNNGVHFAFRKNRSDIFKFKDTSKLLRFLIGAKATSLPDGFTENLI